MVCPCILHWNFNHFVVLDGFRGKYAYLNDPARGEVRVTMEEFDASFTGICLSITPGEGFVPGGKPKSTLEFARKRLSGAGAAMAFVLLSTVIGYLFGIINPAFAGFFMDRLLTGENRDLLLPFIALLSLLGLAQVAAAWIQAVYAMKINGKMAVVGSSTFMWKILRMPMAFFSQRMAGDILQRQSTNASIASVLVNTFTPLLLNAIMMIFYLVVMLRYSPMLTAVGILTIVLNLLVSQLISAKRVNITRVQMRDAGKLSSATVSGIQMVETIKASGAENGYFQKWAGYQASVNAQNVRFIRLSQFLGGIPALLSTIANAAVMVLGVWLTMQGRFTLGSIMIFQGFLSSFMSPAMMLISAGQTLQEMRTEMERVEVEHDADGRGPLIVGDGKARERIAHLGLAAVVDGVGGGRIHDAVEGHLDAVIQRDGDERIRHRAHGDLQRALTVVIVDDAPVDQQVQAGAGVGRKAAGGDHIGRAEAAGHAQELVVVEFVVCHAVSSCNGILSQFQAARLRRRCRGRGRGSGDARSPRGSFLSSAASARSRSDKCPTRRPCS